MEKVQFKISAKAAQLIGRENITDVDGAITELVKNAYDADANCVFIKFFIPFPYIPSKIDLTEYGMFFSKDDKQILDKYYYEFNGEFKKRDFGIKKKIDDRRSNVELQQAEEEAKLLEENIRIEIQHLLFSKNTIIVLDNGCGMSRKIIENDWMHIGTSNKETNSISAKGRVKTGAKGIGRFALDKLSKESAMYTKQSNQNLVFWRIDWDQFINTKLLNDIDAYIEENEDNFLSNVKKIVGEDFDLIKNHEWDNGTMIILNPIREEWSSKLFKKVNRSLSSINPLGNVDKFDIIVSNTFSPEFNYISDSKTNLDSTFYDYKVIAEFDGHESFKVDLYRNEVETTLEEIKLNFKNDQDMVIDAEKFWNRENINREGYSWTDYNKVLTKNINVFKLWDQSKNKEQRENLLGIKNLGSFKLTFFFAKKANSDVEIIKRIKNLDMRKKIFENFSGIKLYRDNFKVRPYGEEDGMFDWLGLGERHLRNPSTVSSGSKWSVDPYSLVGYAEISRSKNSFLYDQANREGLVNNNEYNTFIALLLLAINSFEDDRQLYYREFIALKKKLEPKTAENVAENVKEQKERKKKDSGETQKAEEETDEYSNEELGKALIDIYDEKKKVENAWKAFYAFSSSGVLANTFAHEVNAIATDLSTRANQLKTCLDFFLKDVPMEGLDDYNPYFEVEINQAVDKLLENWVKIIINGLDRQKSVVKVNNLEELLIQINSLWEPLLEKKKIKTVCKIEKDKIFNAKINSSDLQIIINNFNLNSAWFLKDVKKKREITYKLIDENNKIRLVMENNGPPIDEQYKDFPLKIFEIGISTKIIKDSNGGIVDQGTGLGLWIVKEIVEKNFGEIVPVVQTDGFRIDIVFDKE